MKDFIERKHLVVRNFMLNTKIFSLTPRYLSILYTNKMELNNFLRLGNVSIFVR